LFVDCLATTKQLVFHQLLGGINQTNNALTDAKLSIEKELLNDD
jgi:hypothetical protein